MPYRICKAIEMESGHILSKHPANCKFPHGHSRRVELVMEAAELDRNDMVCDFGVVTAAVGDFFDSLDHVMYVNTDDPMYATLKNAYGDRVIGFDREDPTTETIARRVFEKVREALAAYARQNGDKPYSLGANVRLVRVRVWETSHCWAEYGE